VAGFLFRRQLKIGGEKNNNVAPPTGRPQDETCYKSRGSIGNSNRDEGKKMREENSITVRWQKTSCEARPRTGKSQMDIAKKNERGNKW